MHAPAGVSVAAKCPVCKGNYCTRDHRAISAAKYKGLGRRLWEWLMAATASRQRSSFQDRAYDATTAHEARKVLAAANATSGISSGTLRKVARIVARKEALEAAA